MCVSENDRETESYFKMKLLFLSIRCNYGKRLSSNPLLLELTLEKNVNRYDIEQR